MIVACKAVIFDAGNTLIHLNPSSQEVAALFFQQKDLPNPGSLAKLFCGKREIWAGEQSLKELQGAPRMPHDQFIRELNVAGLVGAFPEVPKHLLEAMEEELTALLEKEREWIAAPEAESVLADLEKRGFTLALISNFSADLSDILARVGLKPFFHAIFISEVVGIEKPDPAIMDMACRELELSPDQCVYVGDHPYDVLCAKKAGLQMIWLCKDASPLPTEIEHKPDIIVQSLDEVPPAVWRRCERR
jgi:putative hydrolase of the HAD superfamily